MNVLVVDDSSVMRRIHQKNFEAMRWQVVTAEDGVDALKKLSEVQKCDLLLTDLHMPNMDGIQLIEAVRKLPQFAHLKILMVTSDGVMESVQRALMAGADDLLIKPFSSEVFAEKIRSMSRA